MDISGWKQIIRKQKNKHAGKFQDGETLASDVPQESRTDYEPTPITPTISRVDDKHNISPAI